MASSAAAATIRRALLYGMCNTLEKKLSSETEAEKRKMSKKSRC